MSNKPIKDLLAEIERARGESVHQWMATDGDKAAYHSGEAAAFAFIIDRLKSILAALDES